MLTKRDTVQAIGTASQGGSFRHAFSGMWMMADGQGLQLGQTLLRNGGVEFGPDLKKFLKKKVLRR